MEQKNPSRNRLLIPMMLIILLLASLLVVLLARGKAEETPQEDTTPKLHYAEGYVAVEDPEALQKMINNELEKNKSGISLEYKGVAFSDDGTNFDCYIANAVENAYDMYIDIYADQQLTDEVFLSGLLRPGTAFDTIQLNHPLDPGTTTVYVAFTLVEADQETIHAQTLVTMDFTVNK